MNDLERGPSWYDVAVAADALRGKWGVSTVFTFVPPIRRNDGTGYSSWSVGCAVSGRGEFQKRRAGATQGWGAGGTWKTAPAALHAALRDCEAQLESARRAAEQQAAF